MAALADCFTDGAVFRMALPEGDPVVFEGKEAIMAMMTETLDSQSDQRRHCNSTIVVHGTENGVTRTTHYLTLLATEGGEIRLISAGVYKLEIVEDGGRLRMRRLDLALDRPY